MKTDLFPSGFRWGAASSAFQIEGGSEPRERGESIWDEFCRRAGAIRGGADGRTACDHFRRFGDDVRMMRHIGLRAYRLSISWPRVIPAGVGTPNDAGLDFYDRLIDALLAARIEPWVTLYHWDLPLTLQRRGGWLNRDSAQWLADFADCVTRRLSDRVAHWITINEPQVFLSLGLGEGTHAPGLRLPLSEQLLAAHHSLLGHGLSVRAIRAASRGPCAVGWAPAARVEFPDREMPADIEAAGAAMFSIEAPNLWSNTWFADPVCLGRYPADGLRLFGPDLPRFDVADLETIRQPLDFFGVNIYSGAGVRADPDGRPVRVSAPPGHARNTLHWPVAPEALRWGPRFLWERYKLPIVIAENGVSNLDWVALDGGVHDPQRIDYTHRHLLQLARAVADGVDLRAYFHWSILDNFEWAEGYEERFGLVHVDYSTQKRTLKDSALWYRTVIQTQGASLISAALASGTLEQEALQLANDPLRESRAPAAFSG
ncbi:MAG: GH1 family beta-glucosidase [Phycisphaerae bacterium]